MNGAPKHADVRVGVRRIAERARGGFGRCKGRGLSIHVRRGLRGIRLLFEYEINGFRKRFPGICRLGFDGNFLIRVDEGGATAGGTSRLNVTGLIADHPASGQIELHVVGGLNQHAGMRLAPGMIATIFLQLRFGMKRAVIEPLDEADFVRRFIHEGGDALMHRIDIGLGVRAPGHSALIGHDHETVSGIPQFLKSP